MTYVLPSMEIVFVILVLFNLAIFLIALVFFFKISKMHDETRGIRRDSRHLNKQVAEIIEKEASERIQKIMDEVSDGLEREMRNHFTTVIDKTVEQSREVSQFIKEQEEAIVRESQLMVANIVSRVEKDSEVYRQNQIEKVQGQINSIVAAAAKEVLGKMISMNEHEDLVRQALEKAKKDKFFA